MGSFITTCHDCCCRVIVKLYTSAERRKRGQRKRRPINNRPKFLRIRRKKREIVCKCRVCSCYFNQIISKLASESLNCWSIIKDSEYSIKKTKKPKMVSSQPTPSPRDNFSIKQDKVKQYYSAPNIKILEEPCVQIKIDTKKTPALYRRLRRSLQDESTQFKPLQSSKNIETDKVNFNKQSNKLSYRDIGTSPIYKSNEKTSTNSQTHYVKTNKLQSNLLNTKNHMYDGCGQYSNTKIKSNCSSNVSSRSNSPKSKLYSNRNPIQNQYNQSNGFNNIRANAIKNRSRNSSSCRSISSKNSSPSRLTVGFKSNPSSKSNSPNRNLNRIRNSAKTKNGRQSNTSSRNSSPAKVKPKNLNGKPKCDRMKIVKETTKIDAKNIPNVTKGYQLVCDCTKQNKASQCGNSICQMYCNKEFIENIKTTTKINKPIAIKKENTQFVKAKNIKGLDLAAAINEAIIRNKLESPRPQRKDLYCTKPLCCSNSGPNSPNCKRRSIICYNTIHQPRVICGIKMFSPRKSNCVQKKQNKNPIIRSPDCKLVTCRDINIQTCSPHQSSIAIGTETDYQICRALNMYTRGDNENIGSFSIDAYYTR